MKKALFFIMTFAMCLFVSSCKDSDLQQKNAIKEDVPVRVTSIESAPGEDIVEVIVNEESDGSDKIIVNSEFIVQSLEDSMELDSKDFDFYHIASFSEFNSKTFKFYMVSEVQIYDGISSLLILASSDRQKVCWLVNYDKNNKYLGSLTVGYNESSDSANKTESVINTKNTPYYIDITQSKEIIKVEMLPSGKFNEISRVNIDTDGGM